MGELYIVVSLYVNIYSFLDFPACLTSNSRIRYYLLDVCNGLIP